MSVESIALALHHSNAQGAARMVLVGIANHDGDGGAWPSIATLAKYAGISTRNAIKHVRALEELGEITCHRQQGGSRTTAEHMRPNLYEFLVRCPSNCDRSKNHRTVDNPTGDPLSVVTPPVGSDTPPLSVATPPPLSVATPEPSLEPPLNQSPAASTSPAEGKTCWACGKPACRDYQKYCSHCSGNGLAQPWVDCSGECGQIIKRTAPGMNTWTCPTCRQIEREETK